MAKFFVDNDCIVASNINSNINSIFEISGENANHIINVLRLKVGSEIEVSSGLGIDYLCEINNIVDGKVIAKILNISENITEPNIKITLYQGLPKSEKMELIIQKCVELGIDKIVPVSTDRAIVKLSNKNNKEDKKITRWNKISEAASKQSKRGKIPQVMGILSFKEALKSASEENAYSIIPYEKEENFTLKSFCDNIKENNIKNNINIAVFIGPEGGFIEKEIGLAISEGIKPITLGKRILRTETAGFVTTAILLHELDN